jgi:uncharacterized protein (UPF0332 family)
MSRCEAGSEMGEQFSACPAFYTVSALLQQHDFSSGKHSGVKAFFQSVFHQDRGY